MHGTRSIFLGLGVFLFAAGSDASIFRANFDEGGEASVLGLRVDGDNNKYTQPPWHIPNLSGPGNGMSSGASSFPFDSSHSGEHWKSAAIGDNTRSEMQRLMNFGTVSQVIRKVMEMLGLSPKPVPKPTDPAVLDWIAKVEKEVSDAISDIIQRLRKLKDDLNKTVLSPRVLSSLPEAELYKYFRLNAGADVEDEAMSALRSAAAELFALS